ncbi:uncharacterized protein LOC118220799 isoform X1 [Anguilla anguilla]|uniref:uncharacterized protein LOC118220799 isoform X1 n=1 Tax=Anguilla anguilla TaxID=7936 RepID=UPI0015B08DC7|nr:uncharacterized protein LOC118220799 isoform X1 [Anguilla anguilla]
METSCMVLGTVGLIFAVIDETAEGLVNPAPIVFGDIGQNVTIHSRIKEISNYYTRISWYRLRPSGKVEHLAYFSSYTTKRGRYSGELPKGSDTAYLNFSSATIADSGRYFSVAGTALNLTPGSYSVLAITDSKSLPVMRVFLNRTGAVVCELKGGDPTWSDPQWEIDDAKDGLTLQAETFIDAQDAFIRSSILSLKDGIRALNCVCRHITGVIIRTRVMQDNAFSVQGSMPASGKDQCQLLLYLSPLVVVLLLVTVTASGLWAWRRRK